MKKLLFILFLFTGIIEISCTKNCTEKIMQNNDKGLLVIKLSDIGTKVSNPYLESTNKEKEIHSVKLYIFDKDGKLESAPDFHSFDNIAQVKIETFLGPKTIWALVNHNVINQPKIKTIKDLESIPFYLAENNHNAGIYVMIGKTSCNIGVGENECNINVERIFSRIAVTKIKVDNFPFENIKIKNIFLSNIVVNYSIDGKFPLQWENKFGRSGGESSDIIDKDWHYSYHPNFTFKELDATISNYDPFVKGLPALLYCYPNPTTNDTFGVSNNFTPRKTRLIITAIIDGETCYYPITFEKLEKNTTYTVEVTLKSIGLPEPDASSEKGTIIASLTINNWEQGNTYEEVI